MFCRGVSKHRRSRFNAGIASVNLLSVGRSVGGLALRRFSPIGGDGGGFIALAARHSCVANQWKGVSSQEVISRESTSTFLRLLKETSRRLLLSPTPTRLPLLSASLSYHPRYTTQPILFFFCLLRARFSESPFVLESGSCSPAPNPYPP